LSDIVWETTGSKGRYVLREDGHEAELTVSITTPTLVIADHTEVPDAFRGKGVGLQLAERLIADAREKGFKIMPLCPFVKAQFRKHPDWADVLYR
jgi:predicted GNAT family acetyltransferase